MLLRTDSQNQFNLKTPISYYGGKQNLVKELLKRIPNHTQYVEPFCGGATLFWIKQKSRHEVINDYESAVYNFWNVCKTDFEKLQHLVVNTMHSEEEYHTARKIILSNNISDKVLFAWAFWVTITISFSNKIDGGFAFSNDSIQSKNTRKKRDNFNSYIYERLKDTEIFNRDAIELILMKDTKDTFMYFDPPYAESDCGHYKNSKEVYYRLLEILPDLKCKWLMSSYPSEQLDELRTSNNWNHKDIKKSVLVSVNNVGKMKTECLTWNYQTEGINISLF